MSDRDNTRAHLSEYERAVCYYTLPKVVHPVSLGLLGAYALCVFEALLAMTYGIVAGNMTFTTVGSYSFAAIVAFGIVVFFVRALVNDIRRRKLLAEAEGAPNPVVAASGDIPNPFAEHLLLRHSLSQRGKLHACGTEDHTLEFIVEHSPGGGVWIVRAADGRELFQVRALAGVRSFSFGRGGPARMAVYRDEVEIASIVRHPGWTENSVEIAGETLRPAQVTVRNRGVYVQGKLVGRIYELRGSDYLDVHRSAFNDGLLGYFITLT